MSAPASPLCSNCGRPVLERFCGACGQDRQAHSRSLREILVEVVEHHLFLDSVTLRSLAMLLLQPGRLTEEWLAGRRRVHISPFRIYVVASILFFLALWSSGTALLQFDPDMLSQTDAEQNGFYLHLADDPAEQDSLTPITPDTPRPGIELHFLEPAHPGIAVPERFNRIVQNATGWRAQLGAVLATSMTHPAILNQVADIWLPRVIILVVPLVAGLFALLGGRRQLFFVDHLSFALHLQAFMLLMALPAIGIVMIGLPDWLQDAPALLILGYAVMAHRRVYRNAWWLSGLKCIAVLALYAVLVATSLVATVLWGVAAGA
jgi:Protein of unknown function (DUF3667)